MRWQTRATYLLLRGISNVPLGRSGPRSVQLRLVAKVSSGFPCPCCGYLTLPDEPPGTFFICPVCRWQDDGQQFDDVKMRGGANRVSLREAQANYARLATSDPEERGEARPPLPHER